MLTAMLTADSKILSGIERTKLDRVLVFTDAKLLCDTQWMLRVQLAVMRSWFDPLGSTKVYVIQNL